MELKSTFLEQGVFEDIEVKAKNMLPYEREVYIRNIMNCIKQDIVASDKVYEEFLSKLPYYDNSESNYPKEYLKDDKLKDDKALLEFSNKYIVLETLFGRLKNLIDYDKIKHEYEVPPL